MNANVDSVDAKMRRITNDGTDGWVVVGRIFPTAHFGFRKISVARPLRLNFQAFCSHRP